MIVFSAFIILNTSCWDLRDQYVKVYGLRFKVDMNGDRSHGRMKWHLGWQCCQLQWWRRRRNGTVMGSKLSWRQFLCKEDPQPDLLEDTTPLNGPSTTQLFEDWDVLLEYYGSAFWMLPLLYCWTWAVTLPDWNILTDIYLAWLAKIKDSWWNGKHWDKISEHCSWIVAFLFIKKKS